MSRLSQPVLELLPAEACSVGPSAGLVEGPDGGVVFVFGLATFSYAAGDETGRRLAAVQLAATKIAAAANVSTATVRVALGRVTPRGEKPAQPCGLVHDDVTATADHHGGHGQDVDSDAERAGELVVLAAPVPRTADRVAARFGNLAEAPVVLTQGAQLPLAGLLLALPTLEMTGLLEVATATFGAMSKGFYGLRATLLTGVFLALLREPRAEGAIRVAPSDLGRVLGLDRAPEVKTLRRKLSELAAAGQGAALQAALAAHHARTRPGAVGFLYLDGHVRVYTGTRQLPKTHIARMRIAGPATEETWVGDADGDPVMVITAPPSASLAAELARLLPDLRTIIGTDRPCTVVFDRGGYSPAVFTEILSAGFNLLTYYKGTWTRSPEAAFTTVVFTTPDGATVRYELAERTIDLAVPARPASPTTATPTNPTTPTGWSPTPRKPTPTTRSAPPAPRSAPRTPTSPPRSTPRPSRPANPVAAAQPPSTRAQAKP